MMFHNLRFQLIQEDLLIFCPLLHLMVNNYRHIHLQQEIPIQRIHHLVMKFRNLHFQLTQEDLLIFYFHLRLMVKNQYTLQEFPFLNKWVYQNFLHLLSLIFVLYQQKPHLTQIYQVFHHLQYSLHKIYGHLQSHNNNHQPYLQVNQLIYLLKF